MIGVFTNVYNCPRLREAIDFAVFARIEIGLWIRILAKDVIFRDVSYNIVCLTNLVDTYVSFGLRN